jgi:AraC family transcriptional regulator
LCQSFQWHQDAEYIHLSLEPMLLAQVGTELAPNHRLALETQLQLGSDPLIYQIAIALKTALQIDGTMSKLYADTMANTLAVHLLSRYSTHKQALSHPPKKGLSEEQLEDVIDYIHSHLERDVSLAELANVAQLSVFYFSRLFKQSLGVAPHQYHIQCRVDRAKQLLLGKNLSLAEIAHDVGFANQGHFNYHFKRCSGMTPKSFLRRL